MFNQTVLRRLMAKAYHQATQSPDPSSQNGAIIVKRQPNGLIDVVANGFNYFYKGIKSEVEDRSLKLARIEHAERDAIYNAAKNGVELRGAIMICPWAACYNCARAIIGSGISALVIHKQRYLETDRRWLDEINESLKWIQEADIWVYELDGGIPETKPILISGKLWGPSGLGYHVG